MRTVIGIVLTAIATSGWWYFGFYGWPEDGILILPATIMLLATVGVVMLLAITVAENWD